MSTNFEDRSIWLRWQPRSGQQVRASYRIADRFLHSDQSVSALEPFAVETEEHQLPPISTRRQASETATVFHGPGWLGNAWRNVHCTSNAEGYALAIGDELGLRVARGGASVAVDRFEPKPDSNPNMLTETVLGPGLILALAESNTWCLHASAVTINGRVIVFIGESGAGKSTLARWLGEQGLQHGHQDGYRLCDDVLPVRLDGDVLQAWSSFPQLKLPAEQQPSTSHPELHIAAVIHLRPVKPSKEPDLKPLAATDASLALVRHTVAARLFDAEALSEHLQFATDACRRLRAFQLQYPHNPRALARVRDLILQLEPEAESAPLV